MRIKNVGSGRRSASSAVQWGQSISKNFFRWVLRMTVSLLAPVLSVRAAGDPPAGAAAAEVRLAGDPAQGPPRAALWEMMPLTGGTCVFAVVHKIFNRQQECSWPTLPSVTCSTLGGTYSLLLETEPHHRRESGIPTTHDNGILTSGAPAIFSCSIPFLSLSSLFEYWMVCTWLKSARCVGLGEKKQPLGTPDKASCQVLRDSLAVPTPSHSPEDLLLMTASGGEAAGPSARRGVSPP